MKRLGTELYLGVKFININLYSKRQFNISRHTEKSMGNEKKISYSKRITKRTYIKTLNRSVTCQLTSAYKQSFRYLKIFNQIWKTDRDNIYRS